MLLYGGSSPAGGPWLTDTWQWSGQRWRQLSSTGPQTPYGPALGTDPVSGQPVLLAGGSTQHEGSSAVAYGEQTWRWDGHGWQQQHPAHPLVAGQVLSTVDDRAHHRLLAWVGTTAGDTAQGGLVNQTASSQMWSWDGRDWTRLYAHTADGKNSEPTVAVPGPGDLILGVGFGTFRWTGTSWQRLTAPGAPTTVTAAGYDPVRQRVVAVGQTSSGPMVSDQGTNDDGTYTFDGRRWTCAPLPAPLAHRDGPTLTWDPADRGLLLGYGQMSVGNTAVRPRGFDDSWLLTSSWRQLTD